MGLPRFLKQLRRTRSQPNSPSASQSPTKLSLTKKIFSPRRSLQKDTSVKGSPRSLSASFLRGTISNPGSSDSHAASSELIKDLEDVFKKFDANGDGKISWVDLGSIMSALGHKATEEELRRMVREADRDGDGFIDLEEFIELNTSGVDSDGFLKELRDAFEIFDLDGNGAISCDELHQVLRNLGENSSMEDCERMIRGVDCDGNGMVDFEEFKIMMATSV